MAKVEYTEVWDHCITVTGPERLVQSVITALNIIDKTFLDRTRFFPLGHISINTMVSFYAPNCGIECSYDGRCLELLQSQVNNKSAMWLAGMIVRGINLCRKKYEYLSSELIIAHKDVDELFEKLSADEIDVLSNRRGLLETALYFGKEQDLSADDLHFKAKNLIEVAKILMPEERPLSNEIRQALKSPDKYISKFDESLRYRKVWHQCPELPMIALLHGLESRERLVGIDDNFTAEKIVWKISRLPLDELNCKVNMSWANDARWQEEGFDIAAFLQTLGDEFEKSGFHLIELYLWRDHGHLWHHELTIVKKDDYPKIASLIEESYYGGLVIWNKDTEICE